MPAAITNAQRQGQHQHPDRGKLPVQPRAVRAARTAMAARTVRAARRASAAVGKALQVAARHADAEPSRTPLF